MPENEQPTVCLVSACLAGLRTRYDALIKEFPACMEELGRMIWIPVCPEQLGGMPTPREAADLVGGDGNDVLAGRARVITRSGQDVTSQFINGARQCLAIARAQNITLCCLKAKSPSCGLNPVIGVTAALLRQHGIRIVEY
jgi:uncharacterized protein YbbK (DUF523 family)